MFTSFTLLWLKKSEDLERIWEFAELKGFKLVLDFVLSRSFGDSGCLEGYIDDWNMEWWFTPKILVRLMC